MNDAPVHSENIEPSSCIKGGEPELLSKNSVWLGWQVYLPDVRKAYIQSQSQSRTDTYMYLEVNGNK